MKETVINPLYTHDCSENANGWSLGGGWIIENDIVEIGYLNLGKITSKAYFYEFPGEQTPYPQITSHFDTSASGYTVSKALISHAEAHAGQF